MSEENVQIVREMHEQFARGDFSEFADLTDDFVFVASPELPDAGTYRGAAATRWMTGWVEFFEGHTIEATEIIDAGGDKVLRRNPPAGPPAREPNGGGGALMVCADASRGHPHPGRGIPGTRSGPRSRRA